MKINFTIFICFIGFRIFSQDLNEDLLLSYTFNGNLEDASGNNYNATAYGVNYVADRFGNPDSACYFNGIDSYVEFPNLAVLKPNLPVSFSFWIKYDSNSYQNQVVFNTSMQENVSSGVVFNAQGSSNKYVINCADGSPYYAPDTRRSYISNDVIETTAWHHIAIVINSETNMQIFVDCVEAGGTYSGTGGNLSYSPNPGCIGKHDRSLTLPPDFFKGYIDDFKYWNRALNDDDITKLCEAQPLIAQGHNNRRILTIFPNPANDWLNIDSNQSGIRQTTIIDALGRIVFQVPFSKMISVSSLKAGTYFIKVEADSGNLVKEILIK